MIGDIYSCGRLSNKKSLVSLTNYFPRAIRWPIQCANIQFYSQFSCANFGKKAIPYQKTMFLYFIYLVHKYIHATEVERENICFLTM